MKGFNDLPEDLIKAVEQVISDTVKIDDKKEDEIKEGEDEVVPHESDCTCESCPSKEVKEGVAISPSEVASTEPNSAVGVRNSGSEAPKHVDIVRETDMRPTGPEGVKTEGFRLLIQYATNKRSEFVPELSLPAAPSIEALLALAPGSAEVVSAIMAALDEPHNRPQFSGQNEEVKKKFKRELSEAEEIPLDKLSNKAKAFLNKLPQHKVEAAWSGIHGVILSVVFKTFAGQAARLDSKTLKAIANDNLVRWMEGRGDEVMFGLDYAASDEK